MLFEHLLLGAVNFLQLRVIFRKSIYAKKNHLTITENYCIIYLLINFTKYIFFYELMFKF